MKILSDKQTVAYPLAEAEPEMLIFAAGGKSFAFDANSLMLLLLESDGDKKVAENIGVAYKPNIPLYSRAFVQEIVFQACYTCNLRCSYCFITKKFEGKENSPEVNLSFETYKKTIDRFFPDKKLLPKGKQSIGFFGGEPLMNWKVLQQAAEDFEKLCHPRMPVLRITTNATLITKERAEWLSKRPCSFVVSIDGPKEIHDELRVDRNGHGSFDAAMKGLSHLKDAGLGKFVTLRATFSPSTADSLLTRVQFLNRLMYEGYGRHVSVEPAVLSENTCIGESQLEYSVDDSSFEKMRPLYYDVARWLIAEVKAGRKPTFQHITKAVIERLFYGLVNVTDCFTGETKVSLLDGTERRLDELCDGQSHWFYVMDLKTEKIVPSKGVARKVATGRSVIRVSLDNGKHIDCTPDHKFLLKDGTYKRADKLVPGVSLMPLYRAYPKRAGTQKSYENFYDVLQQEWVSTHVRAAECCPRGATFKNGNLLISEEKTKPQNVRHHVNFNCLDNSPDNLVWISWNDHQACHSHGRSKIAKRIMRKQLRDPNSKLRKYLSSRKCKRLNAKKLQKQRKDPNSNLNQYLRSEKHAEKCRALVPQASAAASKSQKQKAAARQNLKRCRPAIQRKAASKHMYAVHAWKRHLKQTGQTATEYPLARFKTEISTLPNNHTVVGVRRLPKKHDVYCVTVEHTSHNFALSAGVFVKNCGAGMAYISVDPSGDIFACHRPTQTWIGNIHRGGIDEEARAPWVDNRLYCRTTCPTCGIRYLCGGGCREESMCRYGNTRQPVEAICSFRKLFFEVGVWIISELTKPQIRTWIPRPKSKGKQGEKNGQKQKPAGAGTATGKNAA